MFINFMQRRSSQERVQFISVPFCHGSSCPIRDLTKGFSLSKFESNFSVFKIDWNCNSVGLLHHPFWLRLVFRHFWGINFQPFLNYFVWLRITDEGSVPEMRIWSILLIKPDLEWCIHLSRSLFLYFNYLVSVTAGEPRSPRGHM